jgi:microcystin-dependent protein
MDDTRISQLTFGEPLLGGEYIPLVQYSPTISALETLYTTPSALVEYIIGEAAFYPVGAIIPYAGALSAKNIPRGWLLCDGSEVSIDDYPNLYNCIVNTYGDTLSGVFALPNLKGRVIVGYNDTSEFTNFNAVEPSWPRTQEVMIGSTGGEFYHKLTAKDIPCTTTAVSIPSAAAAIPLPTIFNATVRNKTIGETNGTVSDNVQLDNTYDYVVVGGNTYNNCRVGSNKTTIYTLIDGVYTEIPMKVCCFVVFIIQNNKKYYRVLSEGDSKSLRDTVKGVTTLTVDLEKNQIYRAIFDITKCVEIQSATVNVISKSVKSGACYGGIAGNTYVINYTKQANQTTIAPTNYATVAIPSASVSDVNVTQPYMLMNYIIKH